MDVRKVSESRSVMSDSATPWTIHGILQARILEWVGFPFSRVSSQPRDQTQVSHDSWTITRLNAEDLMLLNCGIGEDS